MLKINIKSTQDLAQVETCLYLGYLSSKTGQRSFRYRGVTAWNGLSVGARDHSLEKFKKHVTGIVCKWYI